MTRECAMKQQEKRIVALSVAVVYCAVSKPAGLPSEQNTRLRSAALQIELVASRAEKINE